MASNKKMPLSIKVMISSMVAQIRQFLEVIVLACSAITEIYYCTLETVGSFSRI